MAASFDIFNPNVTVMAKGLAGKSMLIYGGNSLGKTAQSVRMSKPFVIAAESGLNATSNIPYARITSWAQFIKIVKQFTDKGTVDKAREMYDTIIIDEMYAVSLLCQDYVIATYGNGALTLGDSEGKVNLYQVYEKQFFKAINLLLSCDYTVVFIGHAQQDKNGYITPKGDKRCVDPIRDFVDYVIYLESNGVDENNNVINSSAYLAETDRFFARSRFKYTPTYIKEFTAENLEKAIIEGIEKEEQINGIKTVTYAEQKAQNTADTIDYDATMEALQDIGMRFAESNNMDILTEIVENTLGVGKKVTECTKKQIDAMCIILDDLKEKARELNI